MSPLALVLRELHHRWLAALSGVAVVGSAVALVVVSLALARAGEQATRLIQRDMGLNVLILSDQTDVGAYWARGYSDHSMPAEFMDRVQDQAVANRLIPLLKHRVEVHGMSVLLVGIEGERFKGGQALKPVFGRVVPQGSVVLGGAVAARLDLVPGDPVSILGHAVLVQSCLVESGTPDDTSIYLNLQDAQDWLGMAGRINEIQALECHCDEGVSNPLERLRQQLEPLLPGTMILRRNDAADARREQRRLAEETLAMLAPLFVFLAGALMAALGALNARERRGELGVYAALGHGPVRVAAVLLGRSVLIAAVGALLGCGSGGFLAQHFGSDLFPRSAAELHTTGLIWLVALVGTPVFALLASLPATLWSLGQDPLRLLRHA